MRRFALLVNIDTAGVVTVNVSSATISRILENFSNSRKETSYSDRIF